MPDLTLPIAIIHVVVFGAFIVLIFTNKNWERLFFGLMAIGSLVLTALSFSWGHPNDGIAIGAFAIMMTCAYIAVLVRE